jgi:hypothetical protein
MRINLAVLILGMAGVAWADSETVQVQVRFSQDTKYGQYTDALYYPLKDFDKVDPKDIETAKDDRVAGYIYAVEHPAPPKEETKEDLEKLKAEYESYKASVEQQILDVSAKIEAKSK